MTSDTVIVIGAPRSGTNILRDVVTQFPGYETWPCDEINLIWRHGNRDHPSDEFSPDLATPAVASYIRGQFDSFRRKSGAAIVVEKTCANSLRVDFVDRIVPNARYLFITRDGIDAAASAVDRWHAPFDLSYTAAKVRYVPPSDLVHYGARFLRNRLKAVLGRRASDTRQVKAWWGPMLDGQQQLQVEHPLDELCALQWQRCVERSADAFERMDSARVHHVVYEDFARDPKTTVTAVAEFLGLDTEPDPATYAGVSDRSIGKGRAALAPDRLQRLTELVRPTLERLGYA